MLRLAAHGWCQGESCGRNNVVAVPCTPWNTFSSGSIPGAEGLVVFSTLILSITLTLSGALKEDICDAEVKSS